MTTNHHTPIPAAPVKPPADSETFNAPLGELDAALTSHESRIVTLEGEFAPKSNNPVEFLNGQGDWVVPAGTGANIDGHVIQDEGTPLPQRANLNFVGAGVAVTNEAGGTQVTIPGATGGVQSVVAGNNVSVNNADPENPIVSASAVQSVVAGTGISVDATDPENPVVSATGGSGGIPVARVMATGNVNISTALENGDTLNGVTLATGDTVLLPFQTAPAENGLYTVPASGAASRHASYAAWAALIGLTVAVAEGTVGADTLWLSKANAGGTLGVTAINFKVINTQAWRAEYTTYSSFADTGGTVIPYDDTIPQVTEGSQLMSLTFTPLTDTIEIETEVPVGFAVGDARATVAIFKDGAANAIAAAAGFIANSFLVGTPISCERRVTVTPGVQVVISVRVGPGSATGTLYVNGNSATRKYGGVSAAWLKVREVHAGA